MKNRDYILFLAGAAIVVICQFTSFDVDIKGFLNGFGSCLLLYFFIKIVFLRFLQKEKPVDAVGMTNRDYTTFILGGFIASLGYVFAFKDAEIGSFLKAMGYTLSFAFTIKTLYKFILKHKHETT